MVGRVVRIIGGFYFVEPQTPGPIVECAIRGRLKLKTQGILVGDLVKYTIDEDGRGVINEVEPRQSVLTRPYIANVNRVVLVFAHCNPDPIPLLIDKFLVLSEASGIPNLIVFNKTDLVATGKADKLANKYRSYGYNVLCTSVRSNLGKRRLLQEVKGKVSVFAGPSGVGKSALLNMIAPGLRLKTGAVSEKIGRGKHTTREVQLLKIGPDSYVADTPGFSQIALDFMKPEALAGYYPEFSAYPNCRFTSCLHETEPDCRIKGAVSAGLIAAERYQSYLELLAEVKGYWEKRYR
ncbi:ribosome biogenesis GTPase [Hydrogenispora ethanolica]|uniref:Small ribosomal subunit biogenesis GTPase RsgA n=1 Tax=Hydrogenispora ethanolica TaxID=1082276 RepID=A0A4R1R8V3_HYDET|nr:ribosome small subunit-dependent GTPase A [Hydrogenispora ethanolica]TCL62103.1 ribosome biogenesis GTPase [Hydrogenispora ethanolica]